MTIDAKKVRIGDVFELNSGLRLVVVPAGADKLDIDMCRRCIHGDGEGNCVTKHEQRYDEFIHGEPISTGMFECNSNENFKEMKD